MVFFASRFLDVEISRVLGLGSTWTPKVCNMMAFMAVIMALGLLVYILVGFRV